MSTPLTPLHRERGAVVTPDEAGADLLTYGDVPAEYAAGQEGCLLLDRGDRARVAVLGGEAEAFLHRILAGRVRGLEPGEHLPNLLLEPKGKVLFDLHLERTPDGFRLDTDPGRGPELVAALDLYLFGEDVRLEDVSDRTSPLELVGPTRAEVLRAALGVAPPAAQGPTAECEFGDGKVRVRARASCGSEALELDAGPAGAPALWAALVEAGAVPGGRVAADCLRVEAGVGVWGEDVTADVYPQEARREGAFSLEKGCYVGQEVVAKIDTYGGLNKRLMALRIDHDDPVPAGTKLVRVEGDERRELGLVTSWAYSFQLDTGLVLAYVKRKHQAPGTAFELDGVAGTATLVPLPVRPGSLTPPDEDASAPGA